MEKTTEAILTFKTDGIMITKDEAIILAESLRIAKYELGKRENGENLFQSLENLEFRLESFGQDQRRTGRSSLNSFGDIQKRFANTLFTPKRITEGSMRTLIRKREPLGLFYAFEGKQCISCDNTKVDAWTLEFDS
ncbi:MAG: hypothetical protein LAT81_14795 [Oceanicaulis sp.]|nr:hypothetical protein [Oceanicaulis sp.]